MGELATSAPGASWGDADRQHLIRIGLDMTPAERLRWLEDTVKELRPWVGLARKRPESERPSTNKPKAPGTASREEGL